MAYPILMDLLKTAKAKDITKIVTTSTDRLVGTVDELTEIQKLINESEVTIETLDGSHQVPNPTELITTFLARADEQTEEDIQEYNLRI